MKVDFQAFQGILHRAGLALLLCGAVPAAAESPVASYIFPAGAQRGTKIEARVGGLFFHGLAQFRFLDDRGISADPVVKEIETTWFEGPLIYQPDSQKGEDYPKDHHARIAIEAEAPLGERRWFAQTSQGTTRNRVFVIGQYREVVEQEIDGAPLPEKAGPLPVTVNGRIFPREDIDIWEFEAEAGQLIACEAAARQFGYPLEAILEIIGPEGGAVTTQPQQFYRGDPRIALIAPATGTFQVRIRDANFSGLQDYVYRLTLRQGPLVTGHFPMGGEAGKTINVAITTSDGATTKLPVAMPEKSGRIPVAIGDHTEFLAFEVSQPNERVFDGQMDTPGKIESHPIDLVEGESIAAEVVAHALESRLDAVLAIADEAGAILAENDDQSNLNPDSRLAFTAKKTGRYFLRVRDQFSGRGGPGFGYRLRVSPGPGEIDFELKISDAPVNVRRMTRAEAEAETKPKPARGSGLAVELLSTGSASKNDIHLAVEGLPPGVVLETNKLSLRQNKAEVFFRAEPDAGLATAEVTLVGTLDLGQGKTLARRAALPVRLSVVPAVPFKHSGQYSSSNDYPCGSFLVKSFQIERADGFTGPLRALLADRQIRHLQGVTAPVVEIPAGATTFDFAVAFPPRMELGRTSRAQLMLVGEVDGKTVSYTSSEQNDQIIAVMTDGYLYLSASTQAVVAEPGKTAKISVSVRRHPSIAGLPVRISGDVPRHLRGVSVKTAEISPSESEAVLEVTFAAEGAGPFNMPLRLVAATGGGIESVFRAEALVELVEPQ